MKRVHTGVTLTDTTHLKNLLEQGRIRRIRRRRR